MSHHGGRGKEGKKEGVFSLLLLRIGRMESHMSRLGGASGIQEQRKAIPALCN